MHRARLLSRFHVEDTHAAFGFGLGLFAWLVMNSTLSAQLPPASWPTAPSSVTSPSPTDPSLVPAWQHPYDVAPRAAGQQELGHLPADHGPVQTVNYQTTSRPSPLVGSPAIGEVNQAAASSTAGLGANVSKSRLVRTFSSLGVVTGLMIGFIWWTRKNQIDRVTNSPNDLIEVVGRVSLDAKHKAHLVRFGGKLLLLSLDSDGVSKLGEIDAEQTGQVPRTDATGRPQTLRTG